MYMHLLLHLPWQALPLPAYRREIEFIGIMVLQHLLQLV